ncbi:ABC transporter G family member 5-like [Miscanthus floridulus]|uniref:ABC transporter G family member 5-like n=1 Tax=Miscanthus floridulus TaxID=154761 RepID=UPI0034581251
MHRARGHARSRFTGGRRWAELVANDVWAARRPEGAANLRLWRFEKKDNTSFHFYPCLPFSSSKRIGPLSHYSLSSIPSGILLSGSDGVTRIKDLSDAERRRVSIGVEAMHDPPTLILDEPPLRSKSSTLHAMAETHRRIVLLSIHQSGARIVKMFNSVLQLTAGCVLHQGTVDQLRALLGHAGLHLPPHVDAIEFAIDSVDVPHLHHRHASAARLQAPPPQPQHQQPSSREREGRCTLQHLFQLHGKQVANEDAAAVVLVMASSAAAMAGSRYANSRAREVVVLSQRFFKNVARTRQLFGCRSMCMLVAGLALGSIFYDLGEDKVAERVGLFAFLLTFLLLSTMEALPIFLQDATGDGGEGVTGERAIPF